jgi:hypothetical protein
MDKDQDSESWIDIRIRNIAEHAIIFYIKVGKCCNTQYKHRICNTGTQPCTVPYMLRYVVLVPVPNYLNSRMGSERLWQQAFVKWQCVFTFNHKKMRPRDLPVILITQITQLFSTIIPPITLSLSFLALFYLVFFK